MKETTVSLEIARLLRELGFDWDSDSYFDDEGTVVKFQYFETDRNQKDYCGYPEDVIEFAPTQNLAHMWIMSVYSLQVCLYPIGDHWEGDVRDCDLKNNVHISVISELGEYKTYEKALECGLLATLNYLKNKR